MKSLLDFQEAACAQIWEFYQQFKTTKEKMREAELPLETVGTVAWSNLDMGVRYSEIISEKESVPNCCLSIPTGGGKTVTGLVSSIDLAEADQRDNFIVWMVPSDAIYRQVLSNFSPGGMCFEFIKQSKDRQLNLKQANDSWTDEDLVINNKITVLLLSKDALVKGRSSEKRLLIYRNADNVSRLSCLSEHLEPSLFGLLQTVKPIFVVDESHKIYTEIGQDFFARSNISRFILELTATPKSYSVDHEPNVIYKAHGEDLIRNSLIKSSIKYNATAGKELEELVLDVIGFQGILESKLRGLGENIVPKVLISTQFTGSKHSHEQLSVDSLLSIFRDHGISRSEIVVKSSENNELGNRDLDNHNDPAKFILTKTALVEGWDCKSVYVIVLLNQIGATLTNTQIIGRGLRQPNRNYYNDNALNTLYLITNSSKYDIAVKSIKDYLFDNGLANFQVGEHNLKHSHLMKLELTHDPYISYLNFDSAAYGSFEIRKAVESHIINRLALFKPIFDPRTIEHIQTTVSLESGSVGAPTYRDIASSEVHRRSISSGGYNKVFRTLYPALRKGFTSSKNCGTFIQKLLEEVNDLLAVSAGNNQLAADCSNMVDDLRRECLDTKFESLILDNSTLLTGKVSELFDKEYFVSVPTEETVSFNSSLLNPTPRGIFNTPELEFGRFLDSLELKWMKTTPSFKINFPYPLGTFYPDFIVELDGCLTMYIETKGGHILDSPDSVAKRRACEFISQSFQDDMRLIFGEFESCKKELENILQVRETNMQSKI